MKKIATNLLFLLLCITNFSSLFAQDAAWKKMKPGTTVSFASSNLRYAQDKLPQIAANTKWTAKAWRGEKVQVQLLVWSSEKISNLSVQANELTNNSGEKINANNITSGFLRYVITDEFANGCGYRQPKDFDSSLVADPIDPATATAVKQYTVQPVWLSIQVPASATPGEYKGTVTINADKPYQLQVSLTVVNHELPPPGDWTFALDLWQHPAAISRIHNVPLWSVAHYAFMRPYYTMLANAGQKYVTTSIITEPWNHQTYDDFPSLIKWVKKKDGSWYYDYSLFDQYVSFVMSCGINKGINCYSMVPWKLSFQYYDESLSKDTALVAKIGSEEYNSHWSAMLKDFTVHLKEKGWFSITRIAMDERPMADMKAVIALLKNIDPAWKIALAGEYHPEIEKDIYDYCVASKFRFTPEVLEERKSLGKPSTYYTCCVEARPNIFTFSPPAEGAWLGWYAAANGFNGYLRWAYNSWVKDPLADSRYTAWPAGDTYQVYPGPWTSIRFEKLIEGIQDFEKVRILKEEFIRQKNTKNLESLNKLLAIFTIKSLDKTSAATMIEKAQKTLNSY
ncbi:DUF4091 domain-containing protein [Flavihumibacter profundi]|uniref:DUF4091 domain-containing protein n=1 Tax=Flavihumibacter profundi TaxID=2716883 RepID=UPI001CC7B96B|nr:glycoside hydrolase domain-containing protein [Flavihumibacter profundi]MBZ5856093.1 DUF4091 domain-containing protein [Flavihumibacter profundi]